MDPIAAEPDPLELGEEPPQAVMPMVENQPSLRRSARISNCGAAKRYGGPTRRYTKERGEGSGTRQAELLNSMQAEVLQSNPLTSIQIQGIETYCGIIHSTVGESLMQESQDVMGGSIQNPMEGGAALGPARAEEAYEMSHVSEEEEMELGEEESVLSAFNFDSADDLSDEDGHAD